MMNKGFSWKQGMVLPTLALSAVWTLLLLTTCSCNQMDPHVYPTSGPFFEGWYVRIIDAPQNVSLGFLFGRVLPTNAMSLDMKKLCIQASLKPVSAVCKNILMELDARAGMAHLEHEKLSKGERSNSSKTAPLVIASLLLNLDPQSNLEAYSGIFDVSDYSVTKDGKSVVHNPDDTTPPNFKAQISKNVSFDVTPTSTKFQVTVGVHTLTGETSTPVPWGPHGEGPEEWLEHFPLPLHWFVYSLRSTVTRYDYSNAETGKVVRGSTRSGAPVIAHMEKNWGKSFPKAWIWSEGVDPKANVSFAFSSGILTEFGLDIKAQLSGYRNPSKGIHCSFNPANSEHNLQYDGCAGTAFLKVESLECLVLFNISASPLSFSSCLLAPNFDGFVNGCVESYTATASIKVYQRKPFNMELTDSHVIHLAALEFGGHYMCNGKCPEREQTIFRP